MGFADRLTLAGSAGRVWCLANGLALDAALRRLQASYVEVGDISGELWCIDATNVRAVRCSTGGGKKETRKSQSIMR